MVFSYYLYYLFINFFITKTSVISVFSVVTNPGRPMDKICTWEPGINV